MSRFSELKAQGRFVRFATPRSRVREASTRGRTAPTSLRYGGCFQEMFALLAMVAAIAAYFSYRWYGPVIYEAARSHAYLEALRDGATNEEANQKASFRPEEVTNAIRHYSKCHRLYLYSQPVMGTKIWPQIGEAYHRGMSPPLLPETLWSLVRASVRDGNYKFPPVLRARLLVRAETAYEVYYSKMLAALMVRLGLSHDHVAMLLSAIDDRATREAYNAKIDPVDWARTLCERNLQAARL